MEDILKKLAPVPRIKPLLPDLDPAGELALLCRVLFKEGYNDHIAGHVSYLQDDGTFLINPWELAWDEVTASDILRCDAQGRVIAGHWNVTPAVNLHTEIHARRPDVKVILHNHPAYGTVWANARRIPPIFDQTSAQFPGDPVLFDEYHAAVSDQSEGEKCANALGQASCALLANHGVLIVGRDIRQAHLRAITLEWRCKMAWQVEALGGSTPMQGPVAEQMGNMIDGNGFPFLFEAMARRELKLDPLILT